MEKDNDYIKELEQENEQLKAMLNIGKTCLFCPYYIYKSKLKQQNELIERLLNKDKNKGLLYFVIKTINGEIYGGLPEIYKDKEKMLNEVDYECTVYKIDLINQLVTEVDF